MNIHEFEMRAARFCARVCVPAALMFVGAVVSFSATGEPETRIGGVVGSNEKTVASLTLGAVDQGPGMKMRADNKARTYVGLDTRGRGLIAVYAKDGEQPLAGLQSTDDDKGLVAVFNSDKPVAFLTQSGAHPGGGNVTTTDPGGSGVFSAGYDGEGGAACVNHKQSMHCLGIGLPLGGGQ